MGARGFIRDLVGIYLAYEIIRGYAYQNFSFSTPILVATIALLFLSVWFLLERIGILPKMTS